MFCRSKIIPSWVFREFDNLDSAQLCKKFVFFAEDYQWRKNVFLRESSGVLLFFISSQFWLRCPFRMMPLAAGQQIHLRECAVCNLFKKCSHKPFHHKSSGLHPSGKLLQRALHYICVIKCCCVFVVFCFVFLPPRRWLDISSLIRNLTGTFECLKGIWIWYRCWNHVKQMCRCDDICLGKELCIVTVMYDGLLSCQQDEVKM